MLPVLAVLPEKEVAHHKVRTVDALLAQLGPEFTARKPTKQPTLWEYVPVPSSRISNASSSQECSNAWKEDVTVLYYTRIRV